MNSADVAARDVTSLRFPQAQLSIGYVALVGLFFCAPFSVSGLFQNALPGLPTSVVAVFAATFLLVLHVFRIGRVRVDAVVVLVAALLFTPMFVSFVLIPVNALSTGIVYSEFITEELWSRMINILLYGVVLIAGWTVVLETPQDRRTKLLGAYLTALLIFIYVGLWQWAGFYLGVPFPDLGNRTHLHSVSAEVRQYFPGRLTSLASEPSFLAPLMIDAAIVGGAVMGLSRRYFALVLLPAAWVLIFSFSGGGFLNVMVLGAFGLAIGFSDLLRRGRIHRGVLAVAILGVGAIVALHQPIQQLLVPIAGRMNVFFDLQEHDRLYMVVMPFIWFAEDGVVSALFGHGPGSFALLDQIHRLPDGGPIHVTSNNLFTDVLYEQGAVGLLLVVGFFAYLLITGLRGRGRSREYLFGAALTVHLATSSIYRADFMAPRFWVLLLTISILYRAGSCDTPEPRSAHENERIRARAVEGAAERRLRAS